MGPCRAGGLSGSFGDGPIVFVGSRDVYEVIKKVRTRAVDRDAIVASLALLDSQGTRLDGHVASAQGQDGEEGEVAGAVWTWNV